MLNPPRWGIFPVAAGVAPASARHQEDRVGMVRITACYPVDRSARRVVTSANGSPAPHERCTLSGASGAQRSTCVRVQAFEEC
jgi:hypothetical protein